MARDGAIIFGVLIRKLDILRVRCGAANMNDLCGAVSGLEIIMSSL